MQRPLRAVVHGWNMDIVLQAMVRAAGISATGPSHTTAEAATAVEHMLRGHEIDKHCQIEIIYNDKRCQCMLIGRPRMMTLFSSVVRNTLPDAAATTRFVGCFQGQRKPSQIRSRQGQQKPSQVRPST